MPRGKKSSGQRKGRKNGRGTRFSRRNRNGSNRSHRDDGASNILNQTKPFPVVSPSRDQLGGFPAVKKNRLKYVSNIILSGESSTGPYVFQLNGLYDPDITSTGHQPSNFDVWSGIYRTWCVENARFKMQLSVRGDASSLSYYGFLINEDSSVVSSGTGTNELMEQPFGMYSSLPGGDGYSNMPQGPLTAAVPIHTWFGMSKAAMLADPSCRGTASANPTRPLYAIMWASPVNGGTGCGSMNFRVEIEFDVVWMEPKITVHSLVRNQRDDESDPADESGKEGKEADLVPSKSPPAKAGGGWLFS